MMTAVLATEEADPVKRLALVSIGMRDVKDLAGAVGGRTLADLSDAVPGLLLGLGSRAQVADGRPQPWPHPGQHRDHQRPRAE